MLTHRLGVMFDRAWDPAGLPGFARAVEALGVDDLWVVEDLGWNGGLTAAAVALGATERLRVGLGIAPVPYRNPALFAMEVATLARVHPGRFAAGVGHGVAAWVKAVGAAPRSSMALLEENVVTVRALLRGETVALTGREVTLDGLTLVHPPAVVPPVLVAAVREKTVELSGRTAQGTVIAEGHGPADLVWAREHLARAGADAEHELVVLAFCHVTGAGAAGTAATVDTDEAGAAELAQMVAGQAGWLGRDAAELFTVSGTPDEAAAAVRALYEAGATAVVLRPVGAEPVAQVEAVIKAL